MENIQKRTRRSTGARKQLNALNDLGITTYCFYCKLNLSKNIEQVTIDHLIPLSKGGSHSNSNTVFACYECNHNKGSLSRKEFEKLQGPLE